MLAGTPDCYVLRSWNDQFMKALCEVPVSGQLLYQGTSSCLTAPLVREKNDQSKINRGVAPCWMRVKAVWVLLWKTRPAKALQKLSSTPVAVLKPGSGLCVLFEGWV